VRRRILFLRATRGEDTVLYAREGGRYLDKLTTRKRLKQAARAHFKGAVGGKPAIACATIPYPDESWAKASLLKVNNDLCPGKVCTLYGERPVFFRGRKKPLIVAIGEAPGAKEAETGTPFVGRSGKLLDWMFANAGFGQDYAITNTVLCRPPNNRDPHHWEKACCLIRLLAFLDNTKPKGVVLIGAHAARTFFPIADPQKGEKNLPVNCNRTVNFGGMRFLHIRHPAWWLRQGVKSSGKVYNKKVKEQLEEAVFSLKLFRELTVESRVPQKFRNWSWLGHSETLLSRELEKGSLLVPAD